MLHIKLSAIDFSCEESSRKAIDLFNKQIRYDGYKFLYPSFQEVGGIWLSLIREKEKQFSAEIERVFNSMPLIDEEQVNEALNIVDSVFVDARYSDRLKGFAEGVMRRASSFGLSFTLQTCHFDLADSAYRAGIQNLLRCARQNISSELQLYLYNRRLQMDLSSFMTDKISVLKKNGNRFDGIRASVQKDTITVDGASHLIEPGDLIQRKMSNGGEETFEVIDPGFHEKFHSIPAGYQMTVRKLGIPDALRAVQNIVYNVTGPNARINQSSIDNSTNVLNVSSDAVEYIAALRNALQQATLLPEERQSANDVVDALEGQFQSGRPSKPVVTALLAALPHIANIATIATSLQALF